MNTPEELKYTNSDEWLLLDGKTATLGVTDYAQDQLSDVVFVEIAVAPGEVVKKHAHVATIESVKAAADVNIPISGKVIEINESLSNTPELVNSDPFTKAWMVKFEIADPSELSSLMDAKAYLDYCSTRSH
ncbi:MAG: glycine cleavage system H protein [Chloroflexi bacterium]|nr:MAG: glycine cleavage system H protein [Chloroflexota bacterium]MBA4374673.1 glycine cleavage system protein H [Anaerolinea sp.]